MNDITPCVLDLETNILNKHIGNNKASPFYKYNGIVLGKFLWEVGGKENAWFINSASRDSSYDVKLILNTCNLLVGHNIKFDLLYLRKFYNELYLDWLRRGGAVWDTQIVQYLLSGQTHLYPTLDSVSAMYGGTLKDDKIKEYWKNDVDTSAIPPTELVDYLSHDVDNTKLVFECQVEEVDKNDMYALVTTQMDALLALVEMEHNGMKFDKKGATEKRDLLWITLEDLHNKAAKKMKNLLPGNMKAEITPGSNQQVSTVLFGGKVKVVEDQIKLDGNGKPQIYKSGLKKGEVKTKKVEKWEQVWGFGLTPTGKKGKNGSYSVSDDVLMEIVDKYHYKNPARTFVEYVLYYRELAKDISTYYDGLLALLFDDDLIHPNFNQCSTSTGRLSSTSPNAQNISGKTDE